MEYQICLESVNKLETVKRNKLQDSDLAKALAKLMSNYSIRDMKYLDDIAASLLSSLAKTGLSDSYFSPNNLISGEFLGNITRPFIQEIRQEVFNSTKPPFADYEKAVNWIEKNGHIPEGISIFDLHYPLPSDNILKVSYFINGEDKTVTASPQSELGQVIRKSWDIADVTGFDMDSVVFYVLTGIKPHIRPYDLMGVGSPRRKGAQKIELPWKRRSIILLINTELNFSELLKIHNSIRQVLGIKKGNKTLNEKHLQLYQIVERLGGAPKGKGTVKFWNAVMKEWNELYPDNKYKHWKGLQIAYDRTITKLSGRFQLGRG